MLIIEVIYEMLKDFHISQIEMKSIHTKEINECVSLDFIVNEQNMQRQR